MLSFVVDIVDVALARPLARVAVVGEVASGHGALFQPVHDLHVSVPLAVAGLGVVGHVVACNHPLCFTVVDLHIAACVAVPRLLVVEDILADDGTVIGLVNDLHIAVAFRIPCRTVVDDVVAFYVLLRRGDCRPSVQLHVVGLAVVGSVVCVYHLALGGTDDRLPDDMDKPCLRVAVGFRCVDAVLGREHDDVSEEVGLMGLRIVIAFIGDDRIAVVDERAASAEVVGYLGGQAVVQTVAAEGASRLAHDHVLPGMDQLGETVVVDALAVDRHAAGTCDVNTPEGLEPVGFLVEVGAVALERRALIAETDTALGNLHVGHHHLVVAEVVGMVDIELASFLLHRFLCPERLGLP